MKKILLAFVAFLVFILFYSCRVVTNECPYNMDPALKAPDSEIVRLDNYISSNNITATKHSSGIYYQIISQGTGDYPNQCSTVGVTYIGTLTTGAEFDRSNTTIYFPLNTLITGWRIGIPLVKKGGKVRLYIPPDFGYGQEDRTGIPKNSILIFDITLNDIVN